MIFECSATVPDILTGGQNTVAVRMPDHPVAIQLAENTGKALCGTSANISGNKSAINAAEVRFELGHLVDFVVDIGPSPAGVESTIIDVSKKPFQVLRQGAVSMENLKQYL